MGLNNSFSVVSFGNEWETQGVCSINCRNSSKPQTELTWTHPALIPENISARVWEKEWPDKARAGREPSLLWTQPKLKLRFNHSWFACPCVNHSFYIDDLREQGWEHKVCFCIIKMKRFCWGLITLEMLRLLQKHNEYQIYLQKGLFIKIKSWWKMPLNLYFTPGRFKDCKSWMWICI